MDNIGSPLSQSDIDALLQSGIAISDGPIIRNNGKRVGEADPVQILPYDFSAPVFLDPRSQARLEEKAQIFAKTVTARLSVFLKTDFGLKLNSIKTQPFQMLSEGFGSPTFASVFKLEPLTGVGILNMAPRMSMAMVDRMLGGKGIAPVEGRFLTEIVRALVEDVIYIFLQEWVNIWAAFEIMKPTVIGYEGVGSFLQTSAPRTVMLNLTFEATLVDCVEVLQLAIPYTLFKPVLVKMEESANRFADAALPEPTRLPNKDFCEHIAVPVVAQWQAFSLKVADLLRLKPGDVLEMSSDILQRTQLCFSGRPHFEGEVGIKDNHVVVRVNRPIA